MEDNKPGQVPTSELVAALEKLGYIIIRVEGKAVKIFSENNQKMVTRGVIHLELLPRVCEGEFPEVPED
jgi:hypothetical protein